jgi:protein tyrosine phosphatase (PTP) superfamily phosphohydrolase (DUF442 family)
MRATEGHPGRRILRLWAGVQLLLALGAAAHEGPAPNRIDISPALTTSGQPTRAFLETLASQGFQVVIYLAPPTVGDAVAEEPKIVGRQGLAFVNIPMDFARPTAADFQAFTRLMQAFEGRKVFVHCQMNYRASSLVFLHRVVTLREPPGPAWQAVQKAWVPNDAWKKYIVETLRANRVDFDPL